MRFEKSKKQAERERWRTIFITIIGLTIPCYLLGLFLYFVNPTGNRNESPLFPTSEASRTPIDPNALLTQIALTNPPASSSPTSLVVSSATPFQDFTPIPVFTLPSDFTSTPIPTRFITQTPIPTSNIPTSTPTTQAPPTSTTAPIPTQPILIPPSDTPNP